MTAKPVLSARERLLRAADKLFYEEGINSVGIDRVIEKAGVAKASLYSTFGSKEELVRAYLDRRQEIRQRKTAEVIARHTEPRAKMLAIFEYLGELIALPSFRGCAFTRATSESLDSKSVRTVCDDSRSWLRSLFRDLAEDEGIGDTDGLATQLLLLYDGASATALMDSEPNAARVARDIAARVWDEASPRTTLQ